MSEKKGTCFVIAPIGERGSDTRERSDQIFNYVISPPVEDLGYKAIRADHISEPGQITIQVIQHIYEAPLVIADLTGRNPNVFYELAIRHAARKPLVQIIEEGESLPFDVANTRTIYVDHRNLKSVAEAKQEITRQIEVLEADPTKIETPISVALDLITLRQSDNPGDRQLAEIVSAVSGLRSLLESIRMQLDNLGITTPIEERPFFVPRAPSDDDEAAVVRAMLKRRIAGLERQERELQRLRWQLKSLSYFPSSQTKTD